MDPGDPRAPAVCIPPDLHLRIGRTRGWGRREGWTHFDGYMIMPGGRFLALAGGDVRFGGPSDLVAIGRDYDSDHLVARFCVVQRRRMPGRLRGAGRGAPAPVARSRDQPGPAARGAPAGSEGAPSRARRLRARRSSAR